MQSGVKWTKSEVHHFMTGEASLIQHFFNSKLIKVGEAVDIWAVTLMGVYFTPWPEKRLDLLSTILITLHDVMFVLLCSLIKEAAVRDMAGLREGDTRVIEHRIYINHASKF